MKYGETLNWQSVSKISPPALMLGEVHLWWVSLTIREEQIAEFLSHLSDKQHEKMQRLPTEQKRHSYIAGRGFLHQLLSAYLGADKFELTFGRYGKPSVENHETPLQFNFSDTCGYGLFAFSMDAELGVDVESITRQGRFQQIVERRFSSIEIEKVNGQDKEQFLACWTRKEAYGKAMGVGLNYPLDKHVLCDSLDQNAVISPDQKWCLQQFAIESISERRNDAFIACLASLGKHAKELKPYRLDFTI